MSFAAPFSVAGARITGADGVRSFVPVGANIGVNNRVGGTQYPFDEARNAHVVEAAAWGWNTVRLTVSVSEEVSWVNSYGAENAHADIYAAVDNYVDAGFVVVLALMDVTAGNQPRTDGKDADMFAFLSEAAARYVNEPRVWFNVNEPAGVATAEAFQAFHGRMYSAVRNVGNQSIYVADVMTNAQDGTWRSAPIAHDPTVGPAFLQGRTNVVFGLHNYGGQAQNTFTQGMVDAKYLAYIDACQAAGMCVQIFEAGYRVDGLDQAGGTADVNRNVRGFRASLNLPKDRRVGVVVWNGTFDLFGLKNTLKSTYHTQPFWFEGPDGDLSPMGQEFWQYSHLPPLEEYVAQNVNVVQGGLASGAGTTVNLAAPARKAGDIVQFVSQSQYPATPQTTTGYTKVIEQGGFTVWQQDTTVDTAAGNARLNFSGSGTYSAFFQVINATVAVNPNEPTTPTPVGGVAGLTLPTRGWFSGGSGNNIDMNTDKSFGSWRGSAVDFLAHWADAYNGTVWYLPGIESTSGPAYRFKGLLDLAVGGPENGFTSGSTNNRFPTVAAGADDAKFETMLVKLKQLRTIDGVLYPTIIRPFHEMDGNWFRWSVRSSNLTDFGNIMKRWRAIQQRVFPEAIWALCFNGDSYNTDVTPAQMWTAAGGADIVGADRYNQYPTIGTNRAGGYTSWSSGSNSGTVDRPVGAEKWRLFAEARGVPLYFPEYANNGYDSGTPQNATDDPYWVQQWFAWVTANAGKTAGKVVAEGWFNVTGKEEDRWAVYRIDGGVIRHPNVAAGYRNVFQNL